MEKVCLSPVLLPTLPDWVHWMDPAPDLLCQGLSMDPPMLPCSGAMELPFAGEGAACAVVTLGSQFIAPCRAALFLLLPDAQLLFSCHLYFIFYICVVLSLLYSTAGHKGLRTDVVYFRGCSSSKILEQFHILGMWVNSKVGCRKRFFFNKSCCPCKIFNVLLDSRC